MSSEPLKIEAEIAPPIHAALEDAVVEVQRRATVDLAFRNLALNDAFAALAIVAKQPISDDVNIQFVDNSGPVKIIPLPEMLEGITEMEGLQEVQLSDIKGYAEGGWFSWGR